MFLDKFDKDIMHRIPGFWFHIYLPSHFCQQTSHNSSNREHVDPKIRSSSSLPLDIGAMNNASQIRYCVSVFLNFTLNFKKVGAVVDFLTQTQCTYMLQIC